MIVNHDKSSSACLHPHFNFLGLEERKEEYRFIKAQSLLNTREASKSCSLLDDAFKKWLFKTLHNNILAVKAAKLVQKSVATLLYINSFLHHEFTIRDTLPFPQPLSQLYGSYQPPRYSPHWPCLFEDHSFKSFLDF